MAFRLWIVVFLLIGSVAHASSDKVALVIGNDRYQNYPDLDQAGRDARLIERTLTELGFRVIAARDVDGAELRRQVDRFQPLLEGSEIGLVYYAGHAIQVGGRNYVVPVDASQNPAIAIEDQLLDVQSIITTMASAGNSLNVVILDACRDNPFAKTRSTGSRGLSRYERVPSNIVVAYATDPGQVATDSGVYAAALARRLSEECLDLGLVLDLVNEDVLQATRQQQRPWALNGSGTAWRNFMPAGCDQQAQMVTPQPSPLTPRAQLERLVREQQCTEATAESARQHVEALVQAARKAVVAEFSKEWEAIEPEALACVELDVPETQRACADEVAGWLERASAAQLAVPAGIHEARTACGRREFAYEEVVEPVPIDEVRAARRVEQSLRGEANSVFLLSPVGIIVSGGAFSTNEGPTLTGGGLAGLSLRVGTSSLDNGAAGFLVVVRGGRDTTSRLGALTVAVVGARARFYARGGALLVARQAPGTKVEGELGSELAVGFQLGGPKAGITRIGAQTYGTVTGAGLQFHVGLELGWLPVFRRR